MLLVASNARSNPRRWPLTDELDSRELIAELRRCGVGDVSGSMLTRALYSSDASLYRIVPRAVAYPRHPDEVLAILDASRRLEVPVTMRGAGTSIAGNAIGAGIVVDCRKHLNRVLEIEPHARTATVQPGIVHADLQRAVALYGLRFGPDPSTHTRCTIGGMMGNNACGSHALAYGRTADNVMRTRVALGTGDVVEAAEGSRAVDALVTLANRHLAHIRTSFGRFARQISGYSLEHLLPERGRNFDRLVAGSEGTLGVVLEATLNLVKEEPNRQLLLLGYPSMAEAADAVPTLLATGRDRFSPARASTPVSSRASTPVSSTWSEHTAQPCLRCRAAPVGYSWKSPVRTPHSTGQDRQSRPAPRSSPGCRPGRIRRVVGEDGSAVGPASEPDDQLRSCRPRGAGRRRHRSASLHPPYRKQDVPSQHARFLEATSRRQKLTSGSGQTPSPITSHRRRGTPLSSSWRRSAWKRE